MEERFIHSKSKRGYISHALVTQTDLGWVVDFIENERDEKGKLMIHRLTLQRGNDRIFRTLNAAATTMRKIEITKFEVRLL